MTFFVRLKEPKLDTIYALQAAFKEDVRKDKVNLSIGVLLGNDKKSKRFESVSIVEKELFDEKSPKSYLPIEGDPEFCSMATKLVLGDQSQNAFSVQAIGGTGALYLGAKLLERIGIKKILISNPSWPNHKQIFESAHMEVSFYRYYDIKNGCLLFDEMMHDIERTDCEAIVFQASNHNPCGIDPTQEQWKLLCDVVKRKKMFVLFDLSYQGLGQGLDEDTSSIRHFQKENLEMMVATTFSKNFGLYNDRIGALIFCNIANNRNVIKNNIKSIIRTTYSSPPAWGAKVIAKVLQDEKLEKMWKDELEIEKNDICKKREKLFCALKTLGIQCDFLSKANGLFALFHLSADAISTLRTKEGVYLSDDGRINIAALPYDDIERIARGLIHYLK